MKIFVLDNDYKESISVNYLDRGKTKLFSEVALFKLFVEHTVVKYSSSLSSVVFCNYGLNDYYLFVLCFNYCD